MPPSPAARSNDAPATEVPEPDIRPIEARDARPRLKALANADVVGKKDGAVADDAGDIAEDAPLAFAAVDNFPKCEEGKCAADRTLGTKLHWARSPSEAKTKALDTGKLLFVIHVSGNFEQEAFT